MATNPSSRRRFLQIAAGATLVAPAARAATASTVPAVTPPDPGAVASLADDRILIEFDHRMRWRIKHLRGADGHAAADSVTLTDWTAPDALFLGHASRESESARETELTSDTDLRRAADLTRISEFTLRDHHQEAVDGPLGRGTRLRLIGSAAAKIEKTVEIELYERYPGFAMQRASYRNLASQPVRIRGWTACAARLQPNPAEPQFWSYCGSTHSDRRDWVQPVRTGFAQQNFMGMSASDYGGGTPIVDVWRRDAGVAVGHLEMTPEAVSLPVERHGDHVDLAVNTEIDRTLAPDGKFKTHETFIATHRGDYFAVVDAYRRIMSDRGFAAPSPPAAAYEAIWCAWGYERACTVQLIKDTLPKVRDLGLRWAVIDDGWQSNVGDWNLNTAKYPGGVADMQSLVQSIRAHDLKPRLWWAPLAAAPGSDLLHDHTDMLLLDRDGAPQNVSWWNCLYLCPGYDQTVAYTLDLVRRFIGEWGFAGLKIDGQHLNGVAPCFNPAHRHARPEESMEKLQDLFLAVYQTATRLNPDAVVELCPCGTSQSFFNMRALNQAPASDPESSWQVRHKGKTLKALLGPSGAYAGDHVELSDGGQDFASTVGIGAVVSTKFTWPLDPKPKDSFLLTTEKEALWRKWIALYNERVLPMGIYRGELYDIGFDKPETHVVERSGRFYYAFYAPEFNGPIALRGLTAARYRVRDYFNDRMLGEVGVDGRLQLAFRGFALLEAVPV